MNVLPLEFVNTCVKMQSGVTPVFARMDLIVEIICVLVSIIYNCWYKKYCFISFLFTLAVQQLLPFLLFHINYSSYCTNQYTQLWKLRNIKSSWIYSSKQMHSLLHPLLVIFLLQMTKYSTFKNILYNICLYHLLANVPNVHQAHVHDVPLVWNTFKSWILLCVPMFHCLKSSSLYELLQNLVLFHRKVIIHFKQPDDFLYHNITCY